MDNSTDTDVCMYMACKNVTLGKLFNILILMLVIKTEI